MRAIITNKTRCRLDKGELRRVPQNTTVPPLAYHVACPRCGFVALVMQGRDAAQISEYGEAVSIAPPFRCLLCHVLVSLEYGEFQLVEDRHVRHGLW